MVTVAEQENAQTAHLLRIAASREHLADRLYEAGDYGAASLMHDQAKTTRKQADDLED